MRLISQDLTPFARQIKAVSDELVRERVTRSTLAAEAEDLRLRLSPLADLPARIRGILKARAHSRRELVEALGFHFSNEDHTQAVAKAVGEMDDVTKDFNGHYVLQDPTT